MGIHIGGSLSLFRTMWNNTKRSTLFSLELRRVFSRIGLSLFWTWGTKLRKMNPRYELSFLFFVLWTKTWKRFWVYFMSLSCSLNPKEQSIKFIVVSPISCNQMDLSEWSSLPSHSLNLGYMLLLKVRRFGDGLPIFQTLTTNYENGIP